MSICVSQFKLFIAVKVTISHVNDEYSLIQGSGLALTQSTPTGCFAMKPPKAKATTIDQVFDPGFGVPKNSNQTDKCAMIDQVNE